MISSSSTIYIPGWGNIMVNCLYKDCVSTLIVLVLERWMNAISMNLQFIRE